VLSPDLIFCEQLFSNWFLKKTGNDKKRLTWNYAAGHMLIEAFFDSHGGASSASSVVKRGLNITMSTLQGIVLRVFDAQQLQKRGLAFDAKLSLQQVMSVLLWF